VGSAGGVAARAEADAIDSSSAAIRNLLKFIRFARLAAAAGRESVMLALPPLSSEGAAQRGAFRCDHACRQDA
jgi:hypothetical protein